MALLEASGLHKLISATLLMAASFAASASTTLTINTPSGSSAPSGAYIRADLVNCLNPSIVNSGTAVNPSQRFYFNLQSSVTFTIPDNVTQIACSGNQLSFYTFTYVASGVQTIVNNGIGVELNSGTFNLANLNGLTSVPFNPGVIQGPAGVQGIQGPPGAAASITTGGTNTTFSATGFISNCPSVLNTTNICITLAPYNADPTGVTDSTPAFQAAVNALNPSGGTIWVPDGTYKIAGALQSTCTTYAVPGDVTSATCINAQIALPTITNYSTPLVDIAIKGVTNPNWDTPGGAVITTTATSGNMISGYDAANGIGQNGVTNVKLELENLTFRAPANPGVVIINGTWLQAIKGKHLLFNTPGVGTIPTNAGGAAILMPWLGNEVQNQLDDIQIGGYYTGYRIGEHTHAGMIFAVYNHDCFVFDGGPVSYFNDSTPGYNGNSAAVDYLWEQNCDHAIVGRSNPGIFNIQTADLELTNSGGYDIYDPNNQLHGFINYNNPVQATALRQMGGLYTNVTNLWAPSPYYGVTRVAAGPGSGSGSNCLANQGQVFSGASFPSYLCNIAGSQSANTLNTYYNGSNWITPQAGAYGYFRIHGNGSDGISVRTTFYMGGGASTTAGATVPVDGTSGTLECISPLFNSSGTVTDPARCWVNPQAPSPTYPTNAVFVFNPSANAYVNQDGTASFPQILPGASSTNNLTGTSCPTNGAIAGSSYSGGHAYICQSSVWVQII